MNTARVTELLKIIGDREVSVAALRKEAAALEARYTAETAELNAAKRELAGELKHMLPTGRAPRAASSAPAGERKARQPGGVNGTVLEVLADGQDHATTEIAAAVEAKGLSKTGATKGTQFAIGSIRPRLLVLRFHCTDILGISWRASSCSSCASNCALI